MLSQNDLDWFAARLSIAIYDINQGGPEMLIHEMREALKDIPGLENLIIEYEPSGHQLLHIDGKTLEVGPMASNAEIRLALQNPFIRTENTTMSITGASFLADSIKAKIQAAKDRVAKSTAGTDAALAKLNSAADHADQVSKSIEAEADALTAELGQFSNGGPA
jgi:hypothetical protein